MYIEVGHMKVNKDCPIYRITQMLTVIMSIFSHWCQQQLLVMKRALRWYLMIKSELLHDYNQIIG